MAVPWPRMLLLLACRLSATWALHSQRHMAGEVPSESVPAQTMAYVHAGKIFSDFIRQLPIRDNQEISTHYNEHVDDSISIVDVIKLALSGIHSFGNEAFNKAVNQTLYNLTEVFHHLHNASDQQLTHLGGLSLDATDEDIRHAMESFWKWHGDALAVSAAAAMATILELGENMPEGRMKEFMTQRNPRSVFNHVFSYIHGFFEGLVNQTFNATGSSFCLNMHDLMANLSNIEQIVPKAISGLKIVVPMAMHIEPIISALAPDVAGNLSLFIGNVATTAGECSDSVNTIVNRMRRITYDILDRRFECSAYALGLQGATIRPGPGLLTLAACTLALLLHQADGPWVFHR